MEHRCVADRGGPAIGSGVGVTGSTGLCGQMQRLPWAYWSRGAKGQTRWWSAYADDLEANQDHRQLLAVCDDVVRLYPPSDAV
jgi:hypothetical protein